MSDASHSEAPSIAIIGAGLAGLSAAWHLLSNAATPPKLTLFDKSRGLGGRLATRRLPNDHAFNHGAQYVRAGDPRLKALLEQAAAQGQAKQWVAPITDGPPLEVDEKRPRYVGEPGMSALGRFMMSQVDKQAKHKGTVVDRYRQTQITKLDRTTHGWLLEDQFSDPQGPFDHVLIAIPAPQAHKLLTGAEIDDHQRLATMVNAAATPMVPCWSLMAAFERPLTLNGEARQLSDQPLVWIGASETDSAAPWHGYVIHASPEWTTAHLEEKAEAVADQMLELTAEALGTALPPVQHKVAHRWRYAFAPEAFGKACIHDDGLGLTLAGDWCLGNRAESAFLSGVAAAEAINPQA